jgi:hypothetical protein
VNELTTFALPETKAPEGEEILVFGAEATKGDIVFEVSARIPQNEFGLPEFFFRSDLIAGTQLSPDDVDAAAVGLFYFEGYPTLANGSSFWNQLPHEPQKKYELFVKYLDQVADIGIRQLDALSTACSHTTSELLDMSKEFYWSSRARAHDLFITAAEAKRRQYLIRKMENNHFNATDAMLSKLKERFEGEFEDWIEELNAKEAVEVMEMLVKIQRMSVGLTGQHASSTSRDIAPGESSEAILRRLAQGGGMNQQNSDSFASRLQALLDNPEEGATIQAAIIQMTAPGNKTVFSEEI